MKRDFKLLLVLSIATLWVGVTVGSTPFTLAQVCELFSHKLFQTATALSPTQITILWDVRTPRVLLAFLVGGGLAISGTLAQSVLQNPLASPYTLGVSSGASFGAALVILSGVTLPWLGMSTQLLFGFVFSVITIIFVLGVSYRVDFSLSTTTVVLTGMVLSLFFSGLLTLLTALFSSKSSNMELWKMGSFATRGWNYVTLLAPFVCLGLVAMLWLSRELDLFCFGETDAQALGVNTGRIKTIAFLIMAVVTGACIAITGTIGFVDLIAPHVARKFVGNTHRRLLPTSFVVGGVLMVATDTVARTVVSPSELPVGAVTALLGAPFFFCIYQSRKK